MIRQFVPIKYPNITENSPLIQSQLHDGTVTVYIAAHITDDDLKYLNDRIIDDSNIARIVALADYLLMPMNYVYDAIISLITTHFPTALPFLYECHDSIFDHDIFNKFYINKYRHESDKLYMFALIHNNKPALDYMKRRGYIWTQTPVEIAAKYGYATCLQTLIKGGYSISTKAFINAAEEGYLNCLIILDNNSPLKPPMTLYYAALNGHLDCLIYAHRNEFYSDCYEMIGAAQNGHLKCIEYMHEHGWKWSVLVLVAAVENGHFKCLEYMNNHGCKWDTMCMYYAAKYGHFECVKFLHENNCPWNEYAPFAAADGGHFECLQYIIGHNCPYIKEDCLKVSQNYTDCYSYILSL